LPKRIIFAIPWDVHDFDRRFERRRKHLANECVEHDNLTCSDPHDNTDTDRTAIEQYRKHENDELEVSSLSTTLPKLRNAADRTPIPLLEMEGIDDSNELTWALEFQYDCGEATRASYRQQLSAYLISEGLLHGEGDQRFSQLFTKWHPDSTQFDISGNVRDEEMIDKFLEERELKEPDDADDGRRFDRCPWTSCTIELPPGDQRFPPGCGRARSQAARDQLAEVEDDTYESAKRAETPEQGAGVDFVRELAKDCPEVIAAVIDAEVLAEAMAEASPTHPAFPSSPADD